MKASKEVTGSGFAVKRHDGKHVILTNAHVVANQTHITVKKFGSSTKFNATVRLVQYLSIYIFRWLELDMIAIS